MDNKKRMMFILEEDYCFVIIKILAILKALECDKKPFEDFRKMGIIFEFIKDDNNMIFFNKLLMGKELDIFETERAMKIFCDSKLDVAVIKRVLFFLEKQEMVKLSKNNKKKSIDVLLLNNDSLTEIFEDGLLDRDLENVLSIKDLVNRVRTLKLETLQTKIFGYNEVEKWGI